MPQYGLKKRHDEQVPLPTVRDMREPKLRASFLSTQLWIIDGFLPSSPLPTFSSQTFQLLGP